MENDIFLVPLLLVVTVWWMVDLQHSWDGGLGEPVPLRLVHGMGSIVEPGPSWAVCLLKELREPEPESTRELGQARAVCLLEESGQMRELGSLWWRPTKRANWTVSRGETTWEGPRDLQKVDIQEFGRGLAATTELFCKDIT